MLILTEGEKINAKSMKVVSIVHSNINYLSKFDQLQHANLYHQANIFVKCLLC